MLIYLNKVDMIKYNLFKINIVGMIRIKNTLYCLKQLFTSG